VPSCAAADGTARACLEVDRAGRRSFTHSARKIVSSAARSIDTRSDTPARVLVATEDLSLLSSLAEGLALEGHDVSVAHNEQDLMHLLLGLDTGAFGTPDLVVLEARLLGPPSLRLLRRLRVDHPDTRLLFVASRDDRASRVIAVHLDAAVLTRPVRLDDIRLAAAAAGGHPPSSAPGALRERRTRGGP
jgi:ActR/RegA family two-component response regulator